MCILQWYHLTIWIHCCTIIRWLASQGISIFNSYWLSLEVWASWKLNVRWYTYTHVMPCAASNKPKKATMPTSICVYWHVGTSSEQGHSWAIEHTKTAFIFFHFHLGINPGSLSNYHVFTSFHCSSLNIIFCTHDLVLALGSVAVNAINQLGMP